MQFNMTPDDFAYNNEEESEMGQLHAIHNNLNHIARVRRELEAQAIRPTLINCIDCGEEIPKARREAIPGVQHCVSCLDIIERVKR